MTQYEKLCKLIDRLEEVPGHPNMRRESGLRLLLEFIRDSYVCRDTLMKEIREQLRNDPTLLRDALGDTRIIVDGCVKPVIVDKPTGIPASSIDGNAWALRTTPGDDGYSTTVDIPGKFEWIGTPSFDKSDFLRAIFLPDDGIHFAPTVFEVPYIIEDPENMNPGRFERVQVIVKGPIKTDQFPVSIDLLEATASCQKKIEFGGGSYRVVGRFLQGEDGHWEWAPEADINSPGVKRVIYKPNSPTLRAVSTLVRVIREEEE